MSTLHKHFTYIENSYPEMLDLTCSLAKINSGSYNLLGLETVAKKLTEEFSSIADSSENITLANYKTIDLHGKHTSVPLGKLLHFKKNNQAKVNLLFLGHTDTVFDINSDFQQVKPLKTDYSIINGPGVTDMKGGLAVILYTLKTLEKTDFAKKINWEVILNPDEELGSPGSVKYLQTAAKRHHYGLLYEPAIDAHGNFAGQRKGSAGFTIIVHGKAAHAGREFHNGKNAIVAMADIIAEIHSLNDQQTDITFNIGQVSGGTAINIVADQAVCTIGIRSLNIENEQWAIEKLGKIIAKAKQQDKITVELHGGFTKQPKVLDAKTLELYALVKSVGKDLGQELSWYPTGGVCDGNNLSAVGLPNIDTLGVIGGKIHSNEEFLITQSLVERTKLSIAILEKISKMHT
jgi:glutamate carboxypeptidase